MPTVEEKIALARENRDESDAVFRKALRDGRASGMSWPQLATVSGLSVTHVRYLVLNLNEQRRKARKEAQKNGG